MAAYHSPLTLVETSQRGGSSPDFRLGGRISATSYTCRASLERESSSLGDARQEPGNRDSKPSEPTRHPDFMDTAPALRRFLADYLRPQPGEQAVAPGPMRSRRSSAPAGFARSAVHETQNS